MAWTRLEDDSPLQPNGFEIPFGSDYTRVFRQNCRMWNSFQGPELPFSPVLVSSDEGRSPDEGLPDSIPSTGVVNR